MAGEASYIQVRGLSKRYGRKLLKKVFLSLDQVDLDI